MLCTCIFVNGVAPDLEDAEVSLVHMHICKWRCARVSCNSFNDVELAVVIVGGCSCNAFAENMKLFDDNDQIRINVTANG